MKQIFLTSNELDWSVQKVPLSISNGKNLSSYYHIIRTDKGFVLGSCTDNRELKQNSDILKEIKRSIRGTDISITEAFIIDKEGKNIAFNLSDRDERLISKNKKAQSKICVIYSHIKGRYEIKNSLHFNEFKIVINTSYEDDLKSYIKNSTQEMESLVHNMRRMNDIGTTDKFRNEIIQFLINPQNLKWTNIKKKCKEELDLLMKIAKHGNSQLGMLMTICEYANVRFPVKDPNASVYIGKSQSLMNRAYMYMSEVIE